MEWAQVRALVADGLSEREIARRLGINRRTVRRLAAAGEPPRYERAPAGSMLDPLEPVIRKLIEQCPVRPHMNLSDTELSRIGGLQHASEMVDRAARAVA